MEEFYQTWLKLQSGNDVEVPHVEHSVPLDNEIVQEDMSSTTPANIVYENEDLKLIVEKGFHKKQKIFRLQDEIYYIKIVPKDESHSVILLDILDFLHAGFIHILDEIKKHFEPDTHNIAYLTLFQKPMVSGLCT